jgi:hypothetical protein
MPKQKREIASATHERRFTAGLLNEKELEKTQKSGPERGAAFYRKHAQATR